MMNDDSSSKKVKSRNSKMKKISLASKQKLINSVFNQNLTIHQASKIHKINYSSAKYIINVYKKLGTIVQSPKMQCRKSRFYFVNTAVHINQETGQILLFKQSLFKYQNIRDPAAFHLKKAIRYASKTISKKILAQIQAPQQVEKKNESFPKQINSLDQLISILQSQHDEMTNFY